MRLIGIIVLALPLVAQDARPAAQSRADYAGQTWVGLLVPDSCDASHAKNSKTKSQSEADLTVNDRVTTPAVDASGTRGQSKVLSDPATTGGADRQESPMTGDVLQSSGSVDPSWKAARRQAESLGQGCRVEASTSRFALLLPDGRMLRFDDVANQGITKQLGTANRGKGVLRVQAAGKMQNGLIALDTIRF
jgi:hypothetical protein